jgi:poly-gamma-glutamate synthesis protein (capsule biosynthesis protein)
VNLETLFHNYGGFAQAQSGGTWAVSPPAVASELAWAGIEMLAGANNHAFDYGSLGVLENLENVAKAGLLLAGAGKDLQAATAPCVLPHPDGRLALLAAASSFVPYGKASNSRPDLRGRPGVNPLATPGHPVLTLTRPTAQAIRRLAQALGFRAERFTYPRFHVARLEFRLGERTRFEIGTRPEPRDRRRQLQAVREAAANADLVVFSLHAHRQGRWLRRFARDIVEAGAHVFFGHGPHEVRGIEIHQGRPIFYGLGDFAFEFEHIERAPSEAYERFDLGDEASAAELARVQSAESTRGLTAQPATWRGLAAILELSNGAVREIRLLPLDLGFGRSDGTRGIPYPAERAMGRTILNQVSQLSRRYGTRIDLIDGGEWGRVQLS